MKLLNLVPQSMLSAATVCALFLLMAALINTDVKNPTKTLPTISNIILKTTELSDQFEEVDKPEPPTPKPEIEISKVKIEDGPEVIKNISDYRDNVYKPDSNFNLAPISGEMLPIVKAQPEYPRRAIARNIEGTVIVQYDVDELGRTENCSVITAQTSTGKATGIFNRAACKAAAKFRYRPRIVDGQAVAVSGVQNRFVFELND